jgi:hypothetical protein
MIVGIGTMLGSLRRRARQAVTNFLTTETGDVITDELGNPLEVDG